MKDEQRQQMGDLSTEMSILDDLLALDEEEDRRIADELAKATKEPAPIIKDIEDNEWKIKDAGQSNKPASTSGSKAAPNQRETKLKRVLVAKLVWAKCNYFKGGPYLPGRIADPSEAACEKSIPATIKSNLTVIEFFCLPKIDPAIPQYVLVPKTEIRPFDSTSGGKRQLSFTQSYARGKEGNEDGVFNLQWDSDSNEIMRQRLKAKYNNAHANTMYTTIKAKAKEFLVNALDYKDSSGNQSDDCSEDRNYNFNSDGGDSPASEKEKAKSFVRSPESEQVVDLFSLVSKRGLSSAPQTISAGRWISFQHKIFKDRTVYIRVVEVTGNPREPVLLENDDVLRPRDVVCLLDELPPNASPSPSSSSDPHTGGGSGPDKYGKRLERVYVEGGGGYVKGSGSSRPLEEYTFKKGKINFVSLQEELLKETRKCGSILEERLPPSASSSASHTVTAAGASNASSVKQWDNKSNKAGSSSSNNSSRNSNGQSIRKILTVDDDDDDDVIICLDTPEKPSKARAAEDRSNYSDDSDQPIVAMFQKRKRLQADEAQRSGVARSPSLGSHS